MRIEWATKSIGAFIKRFVISLSTRLPSSLLEMRILFEHRILRFQERSAEPQIPRLAPPHFLLRLVALANSMRLSLRERRTRNRVQRSVAGNPGRDDKKERATVLKEWLLNRGAFQI